jgi:patched domain-containing protein
VSNVCVAGIGIDDTFVMLAAWRRTPITLPVPERMGRMLAEAAVSITITSVTDVLSFWIGLASTFPSVQIFCLYTGMKYNFTKSQLLTSKLIILLRLRRV